ncbi:hypothetical protein [Streptomyces sp. NPDC001675]
MLEGGPQHPGRGGPPASAAKLTRRRLRSLLKQADRVRGIHVEADRLHEVCKRSDYLYQLCKSKRLWNIRLPLC